MLFMIGFLSFQIELCLVCFLLFHSGVAERSFFGEERQHISRLALCLVQIEARCFHKPTLIGFKSGAGCTTSHK